MRAAATAGTRVPMIAAGLVAVAVGVGVLLVVTLAGTDAAGMLGDLDIYRGAVSTALAGEDLYSYTYIHPTVHGLGFTYPPFAALVLVPFALLASLPAKVIWTALTFVVTLGCLYLLARQLPDGAPTTLVWLAVAAAVGVLAYWRAARHLRDGSPLAAALAVGALSVAVSPISWPHHQLWLVFAACWYLLLGGRTALLVGAALFAVFLGYPWFDDYPAGTVGTLLGIGIELPALAVLVVLGVGLLPERRPMPEPAVGPVTAR